MLNTNQFLPVALQISENKLFGGASTLLLKINQLLLKIG
jgi:hypothetical protein